MRFKKMTPMQLEEHKKKADRMMAGFSKYPGKFMEAIIKRPEFAFRSMADRIPDDAPRTA